MPNNAKPRPRQGRRFDSVQGPLHSDGHRQERAPAVHALLFGMSLSHAAYQISRCVQLDVDVSVIIGQRLCLTWNPIFPPFGFQTRLRRGGTVREMGVLRSTCSADRTRPQLRNEQDEKGEKRDAITFRPDWRFWLHSKGRVVRFELFRTQQSTAVRPRVVKVHTGRHLWRLRHPQMLAHNRWQVFWHPGSRLQILLGVWELKLSRLHHRKVFRQRFVENDFADCCKFS